MLIKCRECKKKISTEAKDCPQCGAKNVYYVSKKFQIICGAVILLIVLFGAIGNNSKWYNGGNLHNAGALQWQKASHSNKLATCADFIAKLHKDGKLTDSISSKIKSTEDIRPLAEELVKALDETLKEDTDHDKNRRLFANQKVAEMAVYSLVFMEWLKQ